MVDDKNYKEKLYQRIYKYALHIIALSKKLPIDISSQVLIKQLIRSGTSVSANLIEAKAASSKKDYINFYTHALKSANESKLWLSLIRDTVGESNEFTKSLIKETNEIANILAASIITMKKNKI